MRTVFVMLFAGVLMPALAVGGYLNAVSYDPFIETFYPKQPAGVDAELPGALRTIGGIIIGMGALVATGTLLSRGARQGERGAVIAMVWTGLMIAAYGGSFFVAADSAETKIAAKALEN